MAKTPLQKFSESRHKDALARQKVREADRKERGINPPVKPETPKGKSRKASAKAKKTAAAKTTAKKEAAEVTVSDDS